MLSQLTVLRNVIVSGYVTVYQIKKFFVKICYFSVIDKVPLRSGFSPLAVDCSSRKKLDAAGLDKL